jgi:oxygen-independent coproporphyrinogen-3 oxidase
MKNNLISLSSLYLHIPYCGSKCSYCDFFSFPAVGVPDEYVQAVLNQLDWFVQLGLVQELETVYFGGGTPSLLSCHQISTIMERIGVFLRDTAEVTLEVNPESVTENLLETAKIFGINRISMGIQSLNDEVLSCVGRCCTATKARQALALIANSGLAFCTDFIAGLPKQGTPKEGNEDFLSALQEIITYKPYHISMYSLTVVEGTKLYSQIENGQINWESDEADKQWILGRDFLESAGYLQYEVSNFAPLGQESRHNSAYWQQKSYIGLGAGGAGSLYYQGCNGGFQEGFRYTNSTNTEEYIHFWNTKSCTSVLKTDLGKGMNREFCWETMGKMLALMPCEWEKLNQDTLAFEYVMLGLRTKKGISGCEYYHRFGKKLEAATFDGFVQQGWMKKLEEDDVFCGYSMTKEGLLFLNKILEELL